MKKNTTRTLMFLAALMLLNGANNCFASPFDANAVIDKLESGAEVVMEKASSAKEFIKEGASEVKDGVTSGAKSVGNFFSKGYSSVTKKLNSTINGEFKRSYIKKSIFLPGHESKEMVCQGIAYLNGKDSKYTILSYYPKSSDQPSQLVVMNGNSAVRRFALYKSEGKAYTGHAGGIAVAGDYVWVASGNKIYGFETKEMLDFINDSSAKSHAVDGLPKSFDVIPGKDLICAKTYSVDSKASYVSFDGTYLWVGDFTKASAKDYAPVKHHNAFKRNCWIAGYKVDSDGMPTSTTEYTYTAGDSSYTVHKPDAIIAMRESVQGMAICDDHVALTISFGAVNSKLAMYNNPLKGKAEKFSYKPAGQSKTFTVDAWELENKKNWLNTVTLPAGAEDLEYDGTNLYVTFECSSKNYKQKWMNMNPTVKITDNYFLIDVDKALKYKD